MSLGQKLFDLRKERKLSQDDVGKAIQVNKSQVSNWEQGKGNPSVESLMGLAKLFAVSTDYLLFESVPREGVEAINDFELYEAFRRIELLPKERRRVVKEFLDAFIFRERVNEIPERKSDLPQAQPLRKVAGKR
jgi:transcriptional regulator with XRE-family HTH domain